MNTERQPEEILTTEFLRKHPIRTARIIETSLLEDSAALLSSLPPILAAHVLEHTLPATNLSILPKLPESQTIEIFSNMNPKSIISTLHLADQTWRATILGKLDPLHFSSVLQAFSFAENSAGRFANPHVPIFMADRTCSDLIHWLQEQPQDSAEEIYLLDRQHHLAGKIAIRALLSSDLDAPLETTMMRNFETLTAHCPIEQILRSPHWATHHTLPVINSDHTFLGVISYHALVTRHYLSKPNDLGEPDHAESSSNGNGRNDESRHSLATDISGAIAKNPPLSNHPEQQPTM